MSKSGGILLGGIVVGLLLALLIGSAGSETGRYQADISGAHICIIDTTTGHVWLRYNAGQRTVGRTHYDLGTPHQPSLREYTIVASEE